MEAMTVSQAVVARRSIRAFDGRPVDPALLRELLDKARLSPSGGNLQPWNATVLNGKRLDLCGRKPGPPC